MNDLEKRSFYSFLGLYIVSSFLFLAGIGYWYYTAQKNALANETYYKLQHIADMKAGEIIMAHMQGKTLRSLEVPKEIKLVLINTKGKVLEGELVAPRLHIKEGYFSENGYNILISDAPKEHLNIAYVLAQSNALVTELEKLRNRVFSALVLAAFLIVLIAWGLSKLFMKPVHQRVEQIERFINDITHELNTPITSLTMSTNQALQQEGCTAKMLNNISISTKQLYDIYRSLTYLNFSTTDTLSEVLDLKTILEKSLAYYGPLADIKRIAFDVKLEKLRFAIPDEQASLLFGNLIGNAIKYSSPNSKIDIVLENNLLSIKDEGIGIALEKQKEIFEKFKRGTEYSGGFGVGLSIVKRICDEYGIEMTLDSTLNEGTTFTLRFPLEV
ncbi:MAG: sensor histidine kinase [Sulfurovum sp.]|nr:sensor histidine kinase [Sulfurovum sp.]